MNTLIMRGNPRYLQSEPRCDTPTAARRLMLAISGAILMGGMVLNLMPVRAPEPAAPPVVRSLTFTLDQVGLPRPEPVPLPEPEPAPLPEPVPAEEAPRLTPETVLDAPVDTPVEMEAAPAPTGADEKENATAPRPVRRVYGVRKIYARGLGTGAAAGTASGLVTKRGNTLAGPPDSLVATAADLRGRLAPLSSVDSAPQPVDRRLPAYSDAMREAGVSGVVQAWLLVDEEGTVRQVNITEDIGADSRQVAAAALSRFRFRPARRDGAPVAVWILHRIRFQLQQ